MNVLILQGSPRKNGNTGILCDEFMRGGRVVLASPIYNPSNTASRAVLMKLGFAYTGDEFYPPTGLRHPSYILKGETTNEDQGS